MSDSQHHRRAAILRLIIVFVIVFDAAFMWQRFEGVYQSELGAHPDEAAHCVTGLFVRDAMVAAWKYAAGGCQGSPIEVGKAFSETFYHHYPKVALGVWPPGFYIAQAVWTFPFGESRTSLLLFMATLTGLVGTLIFEVTRRAFGMWPASAAVLVWICGPLVREYSGLLMAEMQSSLTMFGAAIAWGAYLDSARRRDALLFALLASGAIMTKGTGLAVLLMCGLTILFGRRWTVLKRPSLWGAAILVVLIAGVWTWYFRNEGTRVGGWEGGDGISWAFTSTALPFYLKALASAVSVAVGVFGLVGMITTWKKTSTWLSMSALVIAIVVFQSVVPTGNEARHILAATPALTVLAVAGVLGISRTRGVRVDDGALQWRREVLWVVLLLLLSLPQSLTESRSKSYQGFAELAEKVLQTGAPGATILISSDASGEGMFISELALRDERPNMIVIRGSKALVDPNGRTWAGKTLKERFLDDDALLAYLLRSKIDYIILDAAVPEEKRTGYHDQIRRVIADNAGTFFPLTESPVTRDGEDLFPPLRLYRVIRDSHIGHPAIPAL